MVVMLALSAAARVQWPAPSEFIPPQAPAMLAPFGLPATRGFEFSVALQRLRRYYFCKFGLAGNRGGASRVRSMVSGFNTEIDFDGTRFHIQTEVRKEADIETAVYVKGAVIHLLKTSHPDLSLADEGHELRSTQLLEGQHRQVIEQIRAGEIRPPSVPASLSDPPGQL
jgi:hypothetical protein